MKVTRIFLSLIIILFVSICSCSDDNSPGTSNNNNNGGGNNTGGCAGGPTTVTDIDGNVYNVVSIGNQCWMKENLKTTHYKNGAPIPTGLSDTLWQTTTSGACADYNNVPANTIVYGKLYNWYAVADPQGLCPTGWHEPEDWEWNVLVKSIDPNADTSGNVSQSQIAGGAMKEIGTTHWASPNIGATNNSGFTGLPGGFCSSIGTCGGVSYNVYWWSDTQESSALGYARSLNSYNSNIDSYNYNKKNGFSVRCVRD